MKKIVLNMMLILSIKSVSQSLILTQGFNEPVIGDSTLTYLADSSLFSSSMPISITGSNSIWNFSSLMINTSVNTAAYVSPGSVPNSTNFANCTVVKKQGALNTFYKSSTTPTTQTEFLGLNSNTISFNFTNTAVVAKYPMSFGSSITDNLSGTFNFSVNGTCSGNLNINADGTGTLKLPNGQDLSNVLRVKSIQTLSLSAPLITGLPPVQIGTIKETYYYYYHASQKYPVLSIEYTKISLITSNTPTVSAIISVNKKAVALALDLNTAEINFKIYPNPSNELLNFSLSNPSNKSCLVEIFNTLGESILKSNLGNNTLIEEIIDLKNINKGVYVLRTSLGVQNCTKKIVIK